MARKQHNELLAGLFVILCGLALVGVIVWLSGVRFGGSNVYLTAPLTAGNTNIKVGSEVFVGPTKVGQVRAIEPDSRWQQFRIEVRLDRDVDIRRDAVVESNTPPLGGDASLTFLTLGTPAAERPSAQKPIALQIGPSPLVRDLQRELGYGEAERTAFQSTLANIAATTGNLAAVSTALKGQLSATSEPNMLSNAMATLSELRESMATLKSQIDPANREGLVGKTRRSLDDVNTVTSQMAEMTANIRPGVESTVANVADASKRIDEYTQNDVGEMLASMRKASNQLLQVMQDFHEVSSTARQVVTVNQDNISEMLSNLNQVSVNLKATAREVRMQPWKLMGKPTVQDVRSQNIQEAARSFADGASELDDAIGRLTAMSQASKDPIAADDPQLVTVRQRIRDSLGKFMQVEQALWKEMAR